jgi:hypothetical protein
MIARLKWYYMNMGPKETLRSGFMPVVMLSVAAINGTAIFVLFTLVALLIGFFATAPFGRVICDHWDRIQRWQTIMRYLVIGSILLLLLRVIPAAPISFVAIVLALGFMHGINFWGASHPNMLTERGVQELRKQASKPGSQAGPLIFIETSKPAAQRPTTNPGPKLR